MTGKEDKFYYSWRYKEVNSCNILTEVRSQHLVGTDSCALFAAKAALEMTTRRKWAEQGIFEKKENIYIDIWDLAKKKSFPCSLKSVLVYLQQHGAKPDKGNQVFSLKDFEELNPLGKVGDVSKMLQHLFNKGPFAASFLIREDFSPGQDIYLCEGRIKIDKSDKKPPSHAVAVVGFGIDCKYYPFWEYLESVYPYVCTLKKEGFNRIIANGFHSVYLILD